MNLLNQTRCAFFLSLSCVLLFFAGACSPSLAESDYAGYVKIVQNAWPIDQGGHQKVTLLRYPLGRIGLWSTDVGEIADSITRNMRVYPCVDELRRKFDGDWRASIGGDASCVRIDYRKDIPAKGTKAFLTVTPNVSIFRYRFGEFKDYGAVVINIEEKLFPSWAKANWTDNTVKIIDNRTIQVTFEGPSRPVYHYIKFSVPAVQFGTMKYYDKLQGKKEISGDYLGAFMKFDVPEVTAAVAISHTSVEMARTHFEEEFAGMDFDKAVRDLRTAWNRRLGKIEIEASRATKELFYTALHTVYTNTISGADGSLYPAEHPYSVSSSEYWQFLGGFGRCSWDNMRATYPLYMLLEPELMTHILNTYKSFYDVDGMIAGNGCMFAGPYGGGRSFASNLFLAGYLHNIEGVDYAKAGEAVKNTIEKHYNADFFTKGYIPMEQDKDSGSHTQEYSMTAQAMALLARLVGDTSAYNKYIGHGKNYLNIWDKESKQFGVKNAEGQWGTDREKWSSGYFEGSTEDWAFAVPHDPYGLIALYGNEDAVARLYNICKKGMMNDYQLKYQFLPIYANAPWAAQEISRKIFVPKFSSNVIAEGFWPTPTGVYYTSNGSAIVCSMLGLFHMPVPGAQWVINSPSVEKAVIHGRRKITITAENQSDENVYIGSIELNGKPYPAHMISGMTLTASDSDIELKLGMVNEPSPIGDIYLVSSDGEVLFADSKTNGLEFEIDPIKDVCSARVYSVTRPKEVLVNGSKTDAWKYDSSEKIVYLDNLPKAIVTVKK